MELAPRCAMSARSAMFEERMSALGQSPRWCIAAGRCEEQVVARLQATDVAYGADVQPRRLWCHETLALRQSVASVCLRRMPIASTDGYDGLGTVGRVQTRRALKIPLQTLQSSPSVGPEIISIKKTRSSRSISANGEIVNVCVWSAPALS